MKSHSNLIGIIAASVLGIAAGYAFRVWRLSDARSDQVVGARPSIISPSTPLSGKSSPSAPSTLVAKTEADLSLSTGVTRWLVWMTAVEKATLQDFPALARLGKNLPGAIRMLAARWIELDPGHMFESCKLGKGIDGFPAEELADLLFEEWPKRDANAAIAALTSNPGWEGHRMQVVNSLMKIDPERGLIALSDWRIESYGPDMQKVFDWAGKDPLHAAEVALGHPAGYATQLALKPIGEAWGNTDPGAALKFATEHSGPHAAELANAVISGWAQRDLAGASKWLGEADERTRNKLLPALLETWGRTDPAAALQWCQENATGNGRKEAIGGLIRGVASKDVDSAANMVAALEPSPVRTQAAGAFAEAVRDKDWFPTAFGNENKTLAPQALAWLNSLDPDALKAALGPLQWGWSRSDPKGMAAFLASPTGIPVAGNFTNSIAQSFCRISPMEAMEWTAQLPDIQRAAAQNTVFYEWHSSQPDVALSWLAQLPAKDPRREPLVRESARYLVNWRPDQPAPDMSQAIANLILTDPPAAKTAIGALELPEEGKTLLLKLLPGK